MTTLPVTNALKKLDLSQERTREWIQAHETRATENIDKNEDSNEDDYELESIAESSVVDSCDDSLCEFGTDLEREEVVSTVALGNQMNALRDLMNSINSVQTVGNVNITNSTNVHIGNVTNINGNIQIITESRRRRETPHQSSSTSSAAAAHKSKRSVSNVVVVDADDDDEEEEKCVRDKVFITGQKFKIPKELCVIMPRHSWLAQTPIEEYQYLKEPVEYVVILHTATESSEKRGINVRMVRDIQCFHIESREWNDIAYNFLIGCDGNIYTGRGWGVVGAHTRGYNKKAIGISFIGCFMKELPTASALTMCKNLLARGVEEGHLAPDYKLVGHCQCNSTQSPGKRLFEEIQTWEHFYNLHEEAD